MRRFLISAILLLGLSAFGQAFTFQDQPYMVALIPAAGGGGFTPPSGLLAWYKGDTGVLKSDGTACTADGDEVQQWNDQSATVFNLSNSVSPSATLYVANAMNGLPGVSFLSAGSSGRLSNTWAVAKAQPLTVFILGAATNSAGYQLFFDGTTDNKCQTYLEPASKYGCYLGSNDRVCDAVNISGNPTVWTWYLDGNNTYVRTNGVDCSAIPSGAGTSDSTGITLGNAYNFGSPIRGVFVECLWFSGTLSDPDRNSVEAYLKTRGGIP